MVMIFMWWGGLLVKLKGLFDRALLLGRTFNVREVNWMGMPKPMLTGRSGRIIMTSDTPGWFMRWAYHNAVLRQLRDQILGFVGIKPAKISYFAGASHPKPGKVDKWISQIQRFAAHAA